ncbi:MULTISPECIES: DedA family protein [Bradyrhizobium]|jgi:alkaline phosphatase|uniref:DedA family protein n=1 Tax=Bradyrhizobium TaxID=374 RepID=UPI00040BA601|nr:MULTISPECIES: DedA family protein [Bradyrhizobium]KIU51410.1 alkaline phosphatase [Bradyrhizobium elkanii]MBK5655820.1 DedA family protein [Rhizobium sp.]OCX31544.1 alkaline phosphatase [Bradyrhizobium sp. UASWS1016]
MDTSSTIAMFLHFGLAGIGCLAIAEKFIPLLPSYVLLMLLGLTVPDGATLAMTILATSAGSVVGAIGWYGLGRTLGSQRIERLVARFGKFVLLRPSLYRQLTDAYRGNHFWVTLIGQTLPTVRIYLALPAGVLRLEPRAFVMATAIGTVIWNMPFLSLGYALRGSGHDPVSLGFWVVVALIAVEVALFLGFRLYKRSLAPRHLAQPRALPARVPLEEGA